MKKFITAVFKFITAVFKTAIPWTLSHRSAHQPNVYLKDGIIYWKRDNGEVMKIGGSGCGKTRYFRKPDLMPTNLRGENNETS